MSEQEPTNTHQETTWFLIEAGDEKFNSKINEAYDRAGWPTHSLFGGHMLVTSLRHYGSVDRALSAATGIKTALHEDPERVRMFSSYGDLAKHLYKSQGVDSPDLTTYTCSEAGVDRIRGMGHANFVVERHNIPISRQFLDVPIKQRQINTTVRSIVKTAKLGGTVEILFKSRVHYCPAWSDVIQNLMHAGVIVRSSSVGSRNRFFLPETAVTSQSELPSGLDRIVVTYDPVFAKAALRRKARRARRHKAREALLATWSREYTGYNQSIGELTGGVRKVFTVVERLTQTMARCVCVAVRGEDDEIPVGVFRQLFCRFHMNVNMKMMRPEHSKAILSSAGHMSEIAIDIRPYDSQVYEFIILPTTLKLFESCYGPRSYRRLLHYKDLIHVWKKLIELWPDVVELFHPPFVAWMALELKQRRSKYSDEQDKKWEASLVDKWTMPAYPGCTGVIELTDKNKKDYRYHKNGREIRRTLGRGKKLVDTVVKLLTTPVDTSRKEEETTAPEKIKKQPTTRNTKSHGGKS